jgi:hypothetical protein
MKPAGVGVPGVRASGAYYEGPAILTSVCPQADLKTVTSG